MNQIIQKIVIANRGEIAIRIINTARKLGIKTVAIFSQSDKDSIHKNFADEAYSLGSGTLQETYLNIDKIIGIVKKSNADALHPGYGFLSENPIFAEACEQNNIIFIGPKSKVIQLMGNKIEARRIAKEIGIPITESIEGSAEELINADINIAYPLLIKAAAGGGGKGMKIVNSPSELKDNIESAAREALNYFGDGTVYIEKYVEEPRHIEVQILADNHGNCIHLFERECTIQRRHQKIIEEAPSPTLNDDVRQKITDAAVSIAKHIGYNNAGTIEFLVDKDLNFYFLEMNTRIQVEHPVTEMITGIDIVEEQISIAKDQHLIYSQNDIFCSGHSIECRIYAENPSNNFLPSPGEIILYNPPKFEAVRIDSSINSPSVVKSDFDPMLAKLVVWGETREDARIRMLHALDEYFIQGIDNNISYLKEIQLHKQYIDNNISTSYCNEYTQELINKIEAQKNTIPIEIIIGGYLIFEFQSNDNTSLWNNIGLWRDFTSIELKVSDVMYNINILTRSERSISFVINDITHIVELHKRTENLIEYFVNGDYFKAAISSLNSYQIYFTYQAITQLIERQNVLHSDIIYEASEIHFEEQGNTITSPMFGKLIKINFDVGKEVKKGDILFIIEAMKMENNIVSHKSGVIESISVSIGQMIESGNVLLTYLKEEE